jgi:hypothetical protein
MLFHAAQRRPGGLGRIISAGRPGRTGAGYTHGCRSRDREFRLRQHRGFRFRFFRFFFLFGFFSLAVGNSPGAALKNIKKIGCIFLMDKGKSRHLIIMPADCGGREFLQNLFFQILGIPGRKQLLGGCVSHHIFEIIFALLFQPQPDAVFGGFPADEFKLQAEGIPQHPGQGCGVLLHIFYRFRSHVLYHRDVIDFIHMGYPYAESIVLGQRR